MYHVFFFQSLCNACGIRQRKAKRAAALAAAVGPVAAKDVTIQPTCNTLTCHSAFQTMPEDLVATIDYKALGPASAP